MLLFITQLFVILMLIDILFDHLIDNSWKDIFKFGASVATAATAEFCEWVKVGTDI